MPASVALSLREARAGCWLWGPAGQDCVWVHCVAVMATGARPPSVVVLSSPRPGDRWSNARSLRWHAEGEASPGRWAGSSLHWVSLHIFIEYRVCTRLCSVPRT